jgi:hypothetical protein
MAKPQRQIPLVKNRHSERRIEMKEMHACVERLIESGEAKSFLVKNGFVTPSGKLTRRYGG